jgi:hypothetical protein
MARKETSSADLERQLAEMQRRLAGAEKSIESGDPTDVGKMAAIYGERQALQGAIAEVGRRLEVARREEAAQELARREAAEQERLAALRERSFEYLGAVVSKLGELEAAISKARQNGTIGILEAAPLGDLSQAAERARGFWRWQCPELIGERRTTAAEEREAFLDELRRSLRASEERLESMRREAKRPFRPGGARLSYSDYEQALKSNAGGVQAARAQLLKLEEPGIEAGELLRRSTAGLDELSDWLANVYEAERRQLAKQQREAEAQASAIMA